MPTIIASPTSRGGGPLADWISIIEEWRCIDEKVLVNRVIPHVTIVVLSAMLVGCAQAPRASGRPMGVDDDTKRLRGPGSPGASTQCHRERVSDASMEHLRQLLSDSDCGVALAAGWEIVRRSAPQEKRPNTTALDESALSRFLGLVEGRTSIAVPQVWEAVLFSATFNSDRDLYFSRLKAPGSKAILDAEGRVDAHRGTVRREGDRWTVESKSGMWSLTARDYPADIAAIMLTDRNAYVAVYGSEPFPYTLFAVDRSSSKVLWSTEVRADGGSMDHTGTWWHEVQLRLNRDTLIVFGISVSVAYIEAFDAETGKGLYKFSTLYSDARDVNNP